MKLDDFDLDAMLAYLDSDEGADPVMLLALMPRWWSEALVAVFARTN